MEATKSGDILECRIMRLWTDQTRGESGSVLVRMTAARKPCKLRSTVPTTAFLQGSAQRLFTLSPLKQE